MDINKFQADYQDPRWFEKRTQILARDGKCRSCGSRLRLHVHHTFYKFDGSPAWDYPDDSLWTLCRDCHADLHEIKRTATVKLSDEEALGIMDTLAWWNDEVEDLAKNILEWQKQEFILECSELEAEYRRIIEQEEKDCEAES